MINVAAPPIAAYLTANFWSCQTNRETYTNQPQERATTSSNPNTIIHKSIFSYEWVFN